MSAPLPGPRDVDVSRFGEVGSAFLSARRVARVVGITLSELATLAGLARNTLTAKTRACKVDVALSPIVRILVLAPEMAGDDQRAAIWFKHQSMPGWAGKTRYDLVRERKPTRC